MNHLLKHMESFEEFKDYFESLVAVLPGHVYWKDLNCRFLGCNDAQAKAVGLSSRSEIVGLSAYDVITDKQSEAERTKQADAINRVDKQVMQTGCGVTLEEPLKLEDGTVKIFLSQKIPLLDKNNQVIGLLGSSMDITPQKLAENEAKEAKEELEKVSQIKQMFLSNMRHDIRTPFAGILGGAQLLAEQEVDLEKKSMLQNMAEASSMLLQYLNDILEFTEIDNGYIPLVSKAFNLEGLLDDCYKLFVPSASQKNLTFQMSYGSRLPKWVISDRFRIQRIIINLLSNAIKFTNEGSVSIGIDFLEKKNDKDGVLKIIVKDTGIGIPNDKKNIIFEKFEMVSPAFQSKYSGAGLGLGAVRDLVKSLNGNIFLQSNKDEGSTFVCVIPFEYPIVDDNHFGNLFSDVVNEDSTVNKAVLSNIVDFKKGMFKVLLVEDTIFAATIAKGILQKCGCVVEIVATGEEAVDAAEQHVYDLIIMDLGLPGIDGIEASKLILKSGLNQQTPIIGLTAHGSDQIKQSCLESGLKDMFVKPLTGEKAKDVLKNCKVAKNKQ